eukprot:5537602-Lingulodinium_polyedra.AAC.1
MSHPVGKLRHKDTDVVELLHTKLLLRCYDKPFRRARGKIVFWSWLQAKGDVLHPEIVSLESNSGRATLTACDGNSGRATHTASLGVLERLVLVE